MPGHPDILIIGGGVIGLTAAYFLAREGEQVEVVDKGDFGQEASWAGAGILAPGNPELARTPMDKLRAQSAATFPALSAELREKTGIDNGFVRCGGLEFHAAGGPSEVEEWHGEGITYERIDEKDIRKLEPAVAEGLGSAYHVLGMGQLRNPRHLKALLAGCRSFGVGLRPGCPVHGFVREGDRIQAVETAAGRLPADKFLVTAGAWTDSLVQQFGWQPGIRPIRGQIALLNSGTQLFRRVLLWGSRYLVPRPDGLVLAGSTQEDAGFNKQTTASAISDLLALATRLVPRLGMAAVDRTWAGLRPGSPDGLPFIGPVPGSDNLYIAAGHFRAGIQLSPATGLVLKELLSGQPLTIPLDSFRLDRTPTAWHRPAFSS